MKTGIQLQLLLPVILLLTPGISRATTYYVGKAGSPSNSCAQAQSPSTPKLTITQRGGGTSCLSAGDTLIIQAGTYTEFLEYNEIPPGTPSNSTIVKAAPGNTVILKPTTAGPSNDVVRFTHSDNFVSSFITLDGLIIDGGNLPHVNDGVRIAGLANNIRVINGEVKNVKTGNCFLIQDSAHDIVISNMKIHDCGSDSQSHGVYIASHNVILELSEIYNNSGYGIHLWTSTSSANNNIVRYNKVYNNGYFGILIGSGDNNEAYNNIVYGNGTPFTVGGLRVGMNSTSNNQVRDNIIYSNAGPCILIEGGTFAAIVQKNICWSNNNNAILDFGSASLINNNSLDYSLNFLEP